MPSWPGTHHKVRDRGLARRWSASVPRPLVFTNGVFDLLHVGHLAVLDAARREGRSLLVGVNSDDSARQLDKGVGRPVVPATDRARLVAALACVDCVIVFDELTPEALIVEVRPDVLVKGDDHRAEGLPGARQVTASGGRVVLVPRIPGTSTSHFLEQIRGPS